MKRYLLIFSLITVTFTQGHGQRSDINTDSLLQILNPSLPDTQRIHILSQIATAFTQDMPGQALPYVNEALLLAQKIQSDELIVEHLLQKGSIHLGLAQYDSSSQTFSHALAISKSSQRTDWEGSVLVSFGHQAMLQGEEQQAISYLKNSIPKIDSLAKPKDLSKALNILSIVHQDLGEYNKALRYAERSLSIKEQLGEKHSIAYNLNNIGTIYVEQSNYPKAIEYFERASLIFQEVGIKSTYANSVSNMGVIHIYMENYEEAEKKFHEALAIYEELEMENGKEGALNRLGSLFFHQNENDKAREYYFEALRLVRKLGNSKREAAILSNIGLTFDSQTEAEKKIAYFNEALAINQQHGYQHAEISSLNNLARMYHIMGNPQQAIPLALKSLKLSRELKAIRQESLNLELLSKIHESTGSYQQALTYYKDFNRIQDSLFSEQNVRELTQTEMRYVFQREKMADSMAFARKTLDLQLQMQRQRNERNIYVAATIIVILLAGFLSWAYWQKQQSNQRLEAKSQTIQTALMEREALIKEIHHRVNNNLQVVSSLLSLQSRYTDDVYTQQLLREGQDRVHAMALIHKNLYQAETFVAIDLPVYLKQLVNALIHSYHIDRQKIQVNTDITPVKLDLDTLIPLGLIINELITNALKYAFKGRESGNLFIKVDHISDQLLVQVSDDGVGLPPEFDIKKNQTMGFKLIAAFMRKMKGSMDIFKQNGTSITLKIPYRQPIRT